MNSAAMPVAASVSSRSWLRCPVWDSLFIGLACLDGAALVWMPSVPIIGLGLWWNANTIAHNFIHRPFFRARGGNRAFSAYLSLLLGLPQTLWRERHLAHHAGRTWRLRWSAPLALELLLVVTLWSTLLLVAPRFFLAVYLPGYVLGLGLCFLQGYYEHADGTTSHYGKLYNWLFFNDGYHVEHHARPGEHWRGLPDQVTVGAKVSRWPAVLRWVDPLLVNPTLNWLERVVLRSKTLQHFVLNRHESALRVLLARQHNIRSVAIIGAGLFPRTAILLRRLLPQARLTLIDRSVANLERARPFLGDKVDYRHSNYPSAAADGADLVVIPLSFAGDRESIYCRPPAPTVLVHDWLWARRGEGVVVSHLLLKRLNCVRP